MTDKKTLHPLETTRSLRETYLRYLRTAFPIQDNRIQSQFWNALTDRNVLLKGPLLEATPEFRKGCSIRELVEQGILEPGFAELCNQELPYERTLYFHQEQAIRKICKEGRNLVVTTGTGSGKTEAFLIPILNHLLKEDRVGALSYQGVRALLLYPMNALANDQMKRLRRLLGGFEAITFGRYIGDTEQTYDKAAEKFYRQFRGEEIPKNELICRDQMRSNPPHILLTNYSMLEYLLLRPEDNTFFDGPMAQHWKYMVLDEAHIYNGAMGTEIAMLMRRLKDRIVKSEPNRLQAIATSATLGNGEKDFPAVVKFASNLFGEPFEWVENDPHRQDIVTSARVQRDPALPTWEGRDPSFFIELRDVVYNTPQDTELGIFADIARKAGVPEDVVHAALVGAKGVTLLQNKVQRFLCLLLKDCHPLVRLQQALSGKPVELEKLPDEIFPGFERCADALIALVDLAVRARFDPSSASLLPARYHVFIRSLEGAYICLNWKKHAPDQPWVFLKRHEVCPHCQSMVWEFRSCYRCGSGYISGIVFREEGLEKFKSSAPPGTDLWSGEVEKCVFSLDGRLVQSDEDDLIVDGEAPESEDPIHQDPWTICMKCGTIRQGAAALTGCSCNDPQALMILNRIPLKNDSPLGSNITISRCVSCGGRNAVGIIRPFLTGQDAPVSVLATSLYQNLPDSTDKDYEWKPGRGRKMLVFSDGRQDAAFFASYFEQTYQPILRRRLLLETLLLDEDAVEGHLRLKDVVRRFLQKAEQANFFQENESYDQRKDKLFKWLMLEFVALDRRISLEGLGLLSYRLVKPRSWRPPEPLLKSPWCFSPEEAWEVTALLFDTLRQQKCVQFPPNVDPRDEDFAPRNQIYHIIDRAPDAKNRVLSWLPGRGPNRRTDFLIRLLARRNPSMSQSQLENYALEMLDGLWRDMVKDPAWKSHFISEVIAGHDGMVYQANYEMWEIVPTSENQRLYQCSRCKSLTYVNINGVCPNYRCDGTLEPASRNSIDWKENHYRHLYQQLSPIPLTAEEHTAQWSADAALDKQQAFVEGNINVLSCSTTFELGVDVGDLQVVVMRNMPPTTANYLQRAGRAGRRTDSTAFALTYAQRRSHDLSYFTQPEKMVSGIIRPPVISQENEKIIRRHIHSVLFAAFFRSAKDDFDKDFKKTGQFFIGENGGPSGVSQLREFIQRRPDAIREALDRLLPPGMVEAFDIKGWGWLKELTASGNQPEQEAIPVLDKAEAEIIGTLEYLQNEKEEVLKTDSKYKYFTAHLLSQRSETIQTRDLLGHLGSQGILPKYGFPTDTVELKTDHINIPEARQIELQRDLRIAISEYAPGAEVVAAKRIWKSGGIYKPPAYTWIPHHYTICPFCKRVYTSLAEEIEICPACHRNMKHFRGRRSSGVFIVPQFGFIAESDEPRKAGESRPERIYSSRIYFSEFKNPDQETWQIDDMETAIDLPEVGISVQHRYSRFGWMLLINEGAKSNGFRICNYCGYTESAESIYEHKKRSGKPPKHKNPATGRDCKGSLSFSPYSLGHRFMTDVIELKFDGPMAVKADPFTWRSVLYAILEGASSALGIRREDIDGTLFYGEDSPVPSLILYDDVPGGAGHVKRILNYLPETLTASLERVSQDCCGKETSCTECLRNYRNQMYHDELKRGLAEKFLKPIVHECPHAN